MRRTLLTLLPALALLSTTPASADPAPFDLVGPDLRVTVTRQGVTLPIGAVPALAAGDKVVVEPMLPDDETAHYILVSAFLRDPTNPPPPSWFARTDIGKRGGHAARTIELTIPATAQHLALFLAPATGGDYRTLRDAIGARPGAFVRAAQDLEQASLDRGRYETYLAAIQHISATHPDELAHLAPEVAGSLHIKINEACLQRQAEFQAACLLDSKQSVVLANDGGSGSSTMSGAASDLALSLSATPAGGAGFYSPYISAIHEIIGIFGAMHTAKYQYIPALGVPQKDVLKLALNTPPSFRDPKSVLMAALPPIRPDRTPALEIVPGAPAACLGAEGEVLPLTATPLLYATAYAHDLALRVHLPDNAVADLPLQPDATRGGLVVAAGTPVTTPLPDTVSATIHGMWGFDAFAGPEVTLQAAGSWQWKANGADKNERALVLTGAAPACVAGITATPAHGKTEPVKWKVSGAHEVTVALPAFGETPGPVLLSVIGPAGTTPAALTVTPPARALPPSAEIIAHSSEPAGGANAPAIPLVLGSPDLIPADKRLNFTLKADSPDNFAGHEVVEVAAGNGEATARLTLGNGLTLVDQNVMVASLVPAQGLNMSAFGPLRARLVRNGVAGKWLPLGTLVRVPGLKQLTCPGGPACNLSGEGLYLLASVATKPDFDDARSVPEGYPGFTLTVPRPTAGKLYVRLHDAPEVVNQIQVSGIQGQ